jgi:hypothetical protein
MLLIPRLSRTDVSQFSQCGLDWKAFDCDFNQMLEIGVDEVCQKQFSIFLRKIYLTVKLKRPRIVLVARPELVQVVVAILSKKIL